MRARLWLAASVVALSVVALTLGLGTPASTPTPSAASGSAPPPIRVEPIPGAGTNRIVLSAQAARHMGLRVEPAVEATAASGLNGAGRPVAVPAAAVLYDADGKTWVYVSPAPLTYVRQAVTVAMTDGARAILDSGPAPGTEVVAAGAGELLGIESNESGG